MWDLAFDPRVQADKLYLQATAVLYNRERLLRLTNELYKRLTSSTSDLAMNLFELISELKRAKIPITNEEMNLPSLRPKMAMLPATEQQDINSEIIWAGCHIRYGDYCIIVLNKNRRIIANISESDIIKLNDRTIEIISINEIGDNEHDFTITIQDTETHDENVYNATEFMEFFKLDTTTYLYNSVFTRLRM